MIRTSCGFPKWWFICSSSPPPLIFLPFFHSVVKKGWAGRFLCERPLPTWHSAHIHWWLFVWIVKGIVTTIVPAHRFAQSCTLTLPRGFPARLTSPKFLFFFLPSADNKDRTQWWIWFSGQCKSAHAFKALLQPAQVDSHLACSWSWCLFYWWLFSMPTLPCYPATNTPQLQPHTPRPVPSGIQ